MEPAKPSAALEVKPRVSAFRPSTDNAINEQHFQRLEQGKGVEKRVEWLIRRAFAGKQGVIMMRRPRANMVDE